MPSMMIDAQMGNPMAEKRYTQVFYSRYTIPVAETDAVRTAQGKTI